MTGFSGDSKYRFSRIQLNIKDKSVNFKLVLAIPYVTAANSKNACMREFVIIGKNGCPVELLWKSSES